MVIYIPKCGLRCYTSRTCSCLFMFWIATWIQGILYNFIMKMRLLVTLRKKHKRIFVKFSALFIAQENNVEDFGFVTVIKIAEAHVNGFLWNSQDRSDPTQVAVWKIWGCSMASPGYRKYIIFFSGTKQAVTHSLPIPMRKNNARPLKYRLWGWGWGCWFAGSGGYLSIVNDIYINGLGV